MNILLQKFPEMEQKNVPLTTVNFYVCACMYLHFNIQPLNIERFSCYVIGLGHNYSSISYAMP